MSEPPSEYRVGNKRPPLHSRFRKGQSGNPEGARRHRKRPTQLAALIEEALNARLAHSRRPVTRREAIVAAIVEKSASGDVRALKLLLDLVQKTGLDREIITEDDATAARQRLIAAFDRLAAEAGKQEAIARLTRDESVCG